MSKTTTMSRRTFVKAAGTTTAAAAAASVVAGTAAADEAAGSAPLTAESYSSQKWSFEIAPEPITDIAEQIDCELVVVGAGTSGLAAACSGAQSGLNTILVSASTGPVCRGGSNHCTYSKVMEREGVEPYDAEKFYLSELAANSFRVDHRKWFKFYNNSEESMNWLLDMLAEEGYDAVLEITNVDDFDSPTNSPVASHSFISADMTMAGVGQQFAVDTLAKNIETAGGQIFYENIARQLVRGGTPNGTEGCVEGVICERADGTFAQYNASKGVVLATGDFSRDKDMMTKYCPWVIDLIDWEQAATYDYNFGLQPNDPWGLFHGDGHKMGLWVGAAWQKVFPCAPMIQGSWVASSQPYGSHRGLLVNHKGERFCNEDMGGAGEAMQAMQLPNHCAYAIWGTNYAEDAAPWYQFGQADGDDPIPVETIIQGWEDNVAAGAYVKADTLEEVVEQLGLPVETTMATIERYNELAAAGKDEDFLKKAKYLQGITDGPFYGASTGAPVFYTVMGGLRTNENMQVCTEDDEPIPGLYNVGTMAGDMFANIYNFRMQGHNYGQCLCFGYLTGKYIAENE